MRVDIEAHINVPSQVKKINNDVGFWTFTATTWWRLYSPYVPMDTGALFQQVVITPKQIEHTVPYANRIYNGNFNFRTDKHALATRLWDIAAKQAKKDDLLVRDMQAYVNSGRMNLS